MSGYKGIIKHPVLLLEALQERVLAYRGVIGVQLIIRSIALFVDGIDARRESARQTKLFAFLFREGCSFVPSRGSEQCFTAQSDFEYSV
jgi:hypothetical protein